jgi:pimeloyl-ACP methyl ester carboxylesterase
MLADSIINGDKNMRFSKLRRLCVTNFGGIVLLLALIQPAHAQIAERIDGERRGTQYTLFKPESWNGDLVVLVHGSLTGLFENLAPGFYAQGYGVAFATLPEELGDGSALKRITRDSRFVEIAFRQHVGKPARTYLVGFSRGAHNMQRMLEPATTRYAGMLSLCGGNGGSQLAWDHFFTARILFDHYFPGVLPGTPEYVPALTIDEYLAKIAPQVAVAVTRNPVAALELASVEQFDLAYNDFPELIGAIVESLAIHSVGVNDLLAAAGGNPFDNTSVNYTGTSDDAALNAHVARFSGKPNARAYLRNWYEPRGRVGATPVMVVHTERDGIVPEASTNDRYALLVGDNGAEDFLLRRVIDRAGHCNFEPAEIFGSFADLVGWAESGIRPAQ